MGVISDALDAQGTLQPGTEGWWRVYGARAQDIRDSDLVATDKYEFRVARRVPYGDIRDTVCPRFIGTDGQTYHIGALQPIVVFTIGTRHTLADSI